MRGDDDVMTLLMLLLLAVGRDVAEGSITAAPTAHREPRAHKIPRISQACPLFRSDKGMFLSFCGGCKL